MLHVSNNSIASTKLPEENRWIATLCWRFWSISWCCLLELDEMCALLASCKAYSIRLSASSFSSWISQEIGMRENKSIEVEANICPSPLTRQRTLPIAIDCLHCWSIMLILKSNNIIYYMWRIMVERMNTLYGVQAWGPFDKS